MVLLWSIAEYLLSGDKSEGNIKYFLPLKITWNCICVYGEYKL